MPRDQYTFGHTSSFRREDNGLGTIVTHEVRVHGTVTMGELSAELERLGAPDEVYASGVVIKWDAEASLEMLENRERQREASVRQREAWERRTLKDLMEKYDVKAIEASEDAIVVGEA